jgi:hypothetical protein
MCTQQLAHGRLMYVDPAARPRARVSAPCLPGFPLRAQT